MDNKFTTEWTISRHFLGSSRTLHVTVNSIISIFSTVVKSAVMIPVASCISQLKWVWFSRGHKLSDFQRFEEANPGPLGSLMLLWTMRGRQLACLGALITVGSLALDFSFQQLVSYPLDLRPAPGAYMPATAIYDTYTKTIFTSVRLNGPETNVVTAVEIGMRNLSASINLVPDCSSGTCTWDENITTLAICSECHDISVSIISDCTQATDGARSLEHCDYRYDAPQSYPFLSTIPDKDGKVSIFKSATCDTKSSVAFQNRTRAITVMQTLGLVRAIDDDYTPVKPYGSECALYWCVNKYAVSITNNTLSENLLDVFRGSVTVVPTDGMSDEDSSTELHLTPPDSFLDHTDRTYLVNSSTYKVTTEASTALESQGLFVPFDSSFDVTLLNNTTDPTISHNWREYTPTGAWIDDLIQLKFDLLEERMKNIAGNMTNAVRMANRALAGQKNTNAAGTVMQLVPKVVVVWAWITIPALLTSLSLLLLILTIWTNSRHGTILWKGSALASFYHPLAQDGRVKIGPALDYKELDKLADKLTVKVERTDKGHHLVSP